MAYPIALSQGAYPGVPVPPPAVITCEVMHPLAQPRVFIRLNGAGPGTPIGAMRKPDDLTSVSLGLALFDQVPEGIMATSLA